MVGYHTSILRMCKSPCIIGLNNGGSKAAIALSGRGRSCLVEILNWDGIAPKEIFLAYSTQFVFLIIRLVPGNVVMVAIDMCWKSPTTGEWIYGIT